MTHARWWQHDPKLLSSLTPSVFDTVSVRKYQTSVLFTLVQIKFLLRLCLPLPNDTNWCTHAASLKACSVSSGLLQELNPKLGTNLKSIYVRKKILFHLSLVTHFIFLVFFPWNINLRSVHQSGFPVQCFLHNPPTNLHFTPQRGLWPAALLGTCLHFLHFNFLTHFF